MINYQEHTLANGLQLLANHDKESELVALNIIYRVGSRNENPSRTGFAHLFEHLMFRGTRLVPDFDEPVQSACGESNAFTTNDYTDYYITLPKANIQTAFWLEADRMRGLNITRQALETEKSVVIEEFNQRFLNQPYGDQWHLLRDMVYKMHPYRWPTIGLTPDHVRGASLAEVKAFYDRYYTPANAILSVSGDIAPEEVFSMAENWFSEIASPERQSDDIATEPVQNAARRLEVVRDVPATQITVAFVMAERGTREFYLCDFITDILAGGVSSRLYQHLVKERKLFSSVNAYITGDVDRGMFLLSGQLLPEVSVESGESALWEELEQLATEPATNYEMKKIKNKFESNTLFGELNVMNKAMNLGFYKMLGDMSMLNGETALFGSIEAAEIVEFSRAMFRPEAASTLIIRANNETK